MQINKGAEEMDTIRGQENPQRLDEKIKKNSCEVDDCRKLATYHTPTSQADLRRINTTRSRDKDKKLKTECLLDQPEE